jgi:hypothetical protein
MGIADYHFHWIDLLPYSPCAEGALPVQAKNTLTNMIKSMNKTACHFIASFGYRINIALIREVAKGSTPVVIWAGQMSNIAKIRLYEAGLIREDLSVAAQNVAGVRTPWCQVRWCIYNDGTTTTSFISIENALHPNVRPRSYPVNDPHMVAKTYLFFNEIRTRQTKFADKASLNRIIRDICEIYPLK